MAVKYVLSHHGIKGQKWGVRNGPPYPIEDKVLRKGTILGNVSALKDPHKMSSKDKRWMYFYNPNDEWDKKVYEGPFSVYLKYYRYPGEAIVKKYRYEVVQDLKMPTQKERIDLFKDMLKGPNGDKYLKELVKHNDYRKMYGYRYCQSLQGGGLFSKPSASNFLKKDEKDIKDAYQWAFGSLMENITRSSFASDYAKKISEKYDAMVDDNNVNKYNKAHYPLIIFNVEKAIRQLDDPKEIGFDELLKNYKDVEKKLGTAPAL